MAEHQTLLNYLDGVESIDTSCIKQLIKYASERFTNSIETLYRFEVDGSNQFNIVSTSRLKLRAIKTGRSRFKDRHYNNHSGYKYSVYEIETVPILNHDNIKTMMLELYEQTKRKSIKTALSILEYEQECIVFRENLNLSKIIKQGIL